MAGSAAPELWEKRLYIPSYTRKAAAHYAKVHPNTVSYWHSGRTAGPTLPDRRPRVPLSYLQLIEVAFVAQFRRLGVKLRALREAHGYLSQTFETEFPFATQKLETDGVHIFLAIAEYEGLGSIKRAIAADREGQVWENLMREKFHEFDYEDGVAIRWHVDGRDSCIAIDPRVAFGAPMVKGTPTWVVCGRKKAGESISEIGENFNLTTREVREMLRFEGIPLAA